MAFETFTGQPVFTISRPTTNQVDFTINHPTQSGWMYSRIWQTTSLESLMTLISSPVTSSTASITVVPNIQYWFTMDAVGEVDGTFYGSWYYGYGPYGGCEHLEDSQFTGFKNIFASLILASDAQLMQLHRLMDLSLVYHLRDSFEAISWYPDEIDIIDGYPEDKRTLVGRGFLEDPETQRELPIVTVEVVSIVRNGLQIGSRDSDASYTFSIDVFAERDGQRDDIVFLCTKFLNGQTLSIKDYNEGFPPEVTNQTISGYMDITRIDTFNTSDKSSEILAEKHSARLAVTVNTVETY